MTKTTVPSAQTTADRPCNPAPSLPASARLPINHCNLPAIILGSLTFQQHPSALLLDSVEELHQQLFCQLRSLSDAKARAENFKDYMRSGFLLDNLDEAGLGDKGQWQRGRADYLRLLRGWMFDSEGMEAAVLKGWVESRFGLLPRYHHGPIKAADTPAYEDYQLARARGLYNTNALEYQLDLLYSYCQFELRQQHPENQHIRLFRGSNRLQEYDVLDLSDPGRPILLLNNLSSFTSQAEQAESFGDTILATQVPLEKILYFPGLLPGILCGESEHLVIGGVYQLQYAAE